ncbi:MAG: hypothetical protein LBK66_14515 [Spirochaetaceae bacterium]|nr:hypothetical protein [Spirochaetaceae bacterium]
MRSAPTSRKQVLLRAFDKATAIGIRARQRPVVGFIRSARQRVYIPALAFCQRRKLVCAVGGGEAFGSITARSKFYL